MDKNPTHREREREKTTTTMPTTMMKNILRTHIIIQSERRPSSIQKSSGVAVEAHITEEKNTISIKKVQTEQWQCHRH